jgi:beta-galactosidase
MRLGVCYYPEHWPESVWADDAARMRDLGITQVRIAEFCWSRLEPHPGQLCWDWLDRAVETLARAGLQIVMCTPTATPPRWLVDRHPDMLAVGADGRPRAFGSRRHYDFSSDAYLEEARRITTLCAERYGAHPAVIAWQTDNEYGCHDTVVSYSANAVRRFRLWLEARYGSVETLNERWGNVFWSMEYRSFAEIDAPVATVTEANPAHRLDYQRFASDEVVRFNRMQCEILRARSPGRAIAHNFMLFFTEFDHYRVAADLDVAAWDSYPIGALEAFWFEPEVKRRWLRTGHPDFTGFHHDLYRGMSRQPFWVMEQQPGPVNWARWNPAPRPGMVRLWSHEVFAHGGDVVSYFRWRQAPFAQEQMHAGLNTPDRRLDVGGREAGQVAAEIALLGAQGPVDDAAAPPGAQSTARPTTSPITRSAARVALVFDYEARWLLQAQPQGADFDYLRQSYEWYGALRALGLDVDIVSSHVASLEAYALVIVPSLPVVPATLVEALARSRAEVLLAPRCGSKVETVQIPAALPPGDLKRLMPIRVWRVESLRPLAEDVAQYGGKRYACRHWREHVDVDVDVEPGAGAEGVPGSVPAAIPDAIVEAVFEDGGGPAVVKAGRVRYLAGWFDAAMQRALLIAAARDAGLAVHRLPEGLRLRRRGHLLYAFNYDDVAHAVPAEACAGARWLVGGAQVPPQGVSIANSTVDEQP